MSAKDNYLLWRERRKTVRCDNTACWYYGGELIWLGQPLPIRVVRDGPTTWRLLCPACACQFRLERYRLNH